ncbi:MAG: GGDEF domain-containing protein [Myxococcales bacterium]|nr:GGDEF domain-containing protein [Myxococcales bacterium]
MASVRKTAKAKAAPKGKGKKVARPRRAVPSKAKGRRAAAPRKRSHLNGESPLLVLLELTRKLTDERPLEEALQAVTDAALELVRGNHSSIRLLDANETELLCGARSGSGRDIPPMTFRRGEGLVGWVVDHRRGVLVDDALADSRFKPDERRRGQGFRVRSLLAEPLWSAGRVIGVLSLSGEDAGVFSQQDLLLARLLANCSAPPIERARLRRLAMTDDLTLAYNQRYLHPRITEEIERSRRNETPLSVLLMDLDHFKNVNDRHGHEIGDVVLRLFADRVRLLVRRVDILIRRGGEEFLLLMPATTLEHAAEAAERIRAALADHPLSVGEGLDIAQTVSIGVATWNKNESGDLLQRRADAAMYRAKQMGRNQIAIAKDDEGSSPGRPAPPLISS